MFRIFSQHPTPSTIDDLRQLPRLSSLTGERQITVGYEGAFRNPDATSWKSVMFYPTAAVVVVVACCSCFYFVIVIFLVSHTRHHILMLCCWFRNSFGEWTLCVRHYNSLLFENSLKLNNGLSLVCEPKTTAVRESSFPTKTLSMEWTLFSWSQC